MPHRLSVALLTGLLACGGTSSPAPAPTPAAATAVRSVDVAGLAAARARGPVVLVDVRTPEEYAGGHVPGAVNLPLDTLEARMGELAAHRDAEVYLICQSGRRSARAAEVLAAAGYTAVNVEGGTAGWRAAGHPVE